MGAGVLSTGPLEQAKRSGLVAGNPTRYRRLDVARSHRRRAASASPDLANRNSVNGTLSGQSSSSAAAASKRVQGMPQYPRSRATSRA